jgi:hypothetical protein
MGTHVTDQYFFLDPWSSPSISPWPASTEVIGLPAGKTWIDVPKPIRQLGRNDFKIPDALASEILPGDTLSVHKFLEFPLPLVPSGTLEAPDLSTYFSKYATDTPDSSMILHLRHLHLPPAKVVATVKYI